MVDCLLINVSLLVSPGYDEIRVDLAKEVLSPGLPSIEALDRCVIIRLL